MKLFGFCRLVELGVISTGKRQIPKLQVQIQIQKLSAEGRMNAAKPVCSQAAAATLQLLLNFLARFFDSQ